MRFRFLEPRRDVASPEQVRALRQLRGWTMEELADAVHASALEVSAWEAGVVQVPGKQALLIRWHSERAAWAQALHAAQERTCPWVRENAPDLYEQMFRKPAGSWNAGDAPVRPHVAGCAHCSDVLKQAERTGGFPAKPDTSDSLWARYWRWVRRLPGWASGPFTLASLTVGPALPLAIVAPWALEAWMVCVLGFAACMATLRVSPRPVAGFLPLVAGLTAGLLGWSAFPGNDLSNPRPWFLAAAVVVVGMGIGTSRDAKASKRKARTLEAGLPESAAGEANSMAPLPEPPEWIRWDTEMSLRERVRALAGLAPFEWVRARLGVPAERSLWQRFVANVLVPTGALAIALLAVEATSWAEHPEGGFSFPIDTFLIGSSGWLAYVATRAPLRRLWTEHPVLAWQGGVSAVFFSMLVACGALVESVSLALPGLWMVTAFCALVLGTVLGLFQAGHRDETNPAAPDGSGPEPVPAPHGELRELREAPADVFLADHPSSGERPHEVVARA